MIRFHEIKESLLHLFFPHVCAGCGSDGLNPGTAICIRCLHELPYTHFEKYPDNPVEKLLWGRLPLLHAMAGFYFSKDSVVQQLLHELKYRGHQDLGIQLGRMLGRLVQGSGRMEAEALVPLPLFPAKEKQRGYNQSMLLCRGMAEVLALPVLEKAIIRPHYTETQTKKGRIQRWQNMDGKFLLKDPGCLAGKHILLVDDVITTGATLESCGRELLKSGCRLSIAALAVAMK